MHRFYGDFSFDAPVLNLSHHRELVHQLADVLKMKKGEQVALFNDRGQEAICTLEVAHKKELVVLVDSVQTVVIDTQNICALFCAVLKKDNFELVVQKAAEVGVTDIYPVITDRTVKQGLRLDRLYAIATEATEQSHRMRVPAIHPIIDSAKEAMAVAEELGGLHLCLDMSHEQIHDVLAENKQHKVASVFVGPEGGWSDAERNMFLQENWRMVSLGDGVYRAETAAIVASYLVANN